MWALLMMVPEWGLYEFMATERFVMMAADADITGWLRREGSAGEMGVSRPGKADKPLHISKIVDFGTS